LLVLRNDVLCWVAHKFGLLRSIFHTAAAAGF
jgi:hypothetical protein